MKKPSLTYKEAFKIGMIAARMSWCDNRDKRGELADEIAGIFAKAEELP